MEKLRFVFANGIEIFIETGRLMAFSMYDDETVIEFELSQGDECVGYKLDLVNQELKEVSRRDRVVDETFLKCLTDEGLERYKAKVKNERNAGRKKIEGFDYDDYLRQKELGIENEVLAIEYGVSVATLYRRLAEERKKRGQEERLHDNFTE